MNWRQVPEYFPVFDCAESEAAYDVYYGENEGSVFSSPFEKSCPIHSVLGLVYSTKYH